jgi:signal transduction histidine kinase
MLSLRARLLASFALVIALSLVAAGSASVWLLRDQQAAAAEERIGRLVEPISQELRRVQLLGWPQERIAEQMAAYARAFNVRILLVDSENLVTLDTNLKEPMVGTHIPAIATQPAGSNAGFRPSEAYRSSRARHANKDLFLFAPADRRAGAPAGWPFQISETNLVVAVPAGDVTAAWARLLPRLLVGAGIAALAGVVVAVMLARRITRPIVQMTQASRAMALGDFSQRIEVRGDDEVAALGRAFNEMAQQVDRSRHAMRQLIADVSHDLKTPLTSIQGYSQALLDGVLRDELERARAAEVVHEEAERMRALVEDLLYLSQIEAGQLPLTIERVDLDAVARASAQRFRLQADAAEVSIRTALGGAPVIADERRLEQVLANLLDNAIRFATPGSEVLLRTARVPGAVLLEVHNGGDPIPAEDLPYLFDRFYQVDRARTRGSQMHSGLGLAIVRELVQAHGGEVSVQSSRDGGTVFTVRLPAAPAAANQSARSDDSERRPASARATT